MRWGLAWAGRCKLYKYRYNPVQNIRKGGFEEFLRLFVVVLLESVRGSTTSASSTSVPVPGLRGSSTATREVRRLNRSLCGFLPSLQAGEATATKKRTGVLSPSTLNIHQLSGVFPLPSFGLCSPAFRVSIPPSNAGAHLVPQRCAVVQLCSILAVEADRASRDARFRWRPLASSSSVMEKRNGHLTDDTRARLIYRLPPTARGVSRRPGTPWSAMIA